MEIPDRGETSESPDCLQLKSRKMPHCEVGERGRQGLRYTVTTRRLYLMLHCHPQERGRLYLTLHCHHQEVGERGGLYLMLHCHPQEVGERGRTLHCPHQAGSMFRQAVV